MLIPDCVSSFPSVTPVACSEMVTGVGADRHWISGMNWYHRLERRYVEYGSSLDATRAFGVFRALYDLVYNMNLAHLSPEVETLFERLDDAGARTACTPFLIYRGRHRHQVSLEGLLRRAVDATRLKFHHHTWGPTDLFYGDLYASREVPCKSTSIPGNRDDYAACCAAELVKRGPLRLPPALAAGQRQLLAPARARGERRVDRQGRRLLRASSSRRPGGLDAFLDEHALILVADHAPDRGPPRPAAGRAAGPASGRCCSPPTTAPSWPSSRSARPAARRTSTCCRGRGSGRDPVAVRREAGGDRGRRPGLPAGGRRRAAAAPRGAGDAGRRAASGRSSSDGARRLRFRPGEARSPTCAAAAGRSRASWRRWAAVVEDGRLRSETYPDPLARVWSALTAPHSGDFIVSLEPGFEAVDWGGVTHAGGGSHGALHAGDSLGPAALRRLRPGVGGRARAVDAARRGAGRCSSTSGLDE